MSLYFRPLPPYGLDHEHVYFYANLLLRLPYQSTLTAVFSACEDTPVLLKGTYLSLTREGMPEDFVPSLPEAARADHCPRLDPLSRRQEEGGSDRRPRLLSCDHSFHELCLRDWFEVRKTCPYCFERPEPADRGDPPLPLELKERRTDGRMRVGAVAEEILRFMRERGIVRPNETKVTLPEARPLLRGHFEWGEPFGPHRLFSRLLLRMPYRYVLEAFLTLYERDRLVLNVVGGELREKGIPFDIVENLIRAPTAVHCPSLCPLRDDAREGCRRLPECGHSFHDTCLRVWFRVRKNCPACLREMQQWREHGGKNPLKRETDVVKRHLEGMTVEEMETEIFRFLYPRAVVD